MREYHSNSYNGCFLFGNKSFSFKLPNYVEQCCENTVLLFEDFTEFQNLRNENEFVWIMDINGKINLYNNDCCSMSKENVLLRLNGKYSVFLQDFSYGCPVLALVEEK